MPLSGLERHRVPLSCPLTNSALLASAQREDSPSRQRVAALYPIARNTPTKRDGYNYRSRALDFESTEGWRMLTIGTGQQGVSFPFEFKPSLRPGRSRMWIEARMVFSAHKEDPGEHVCTDPQDVEMGR